MTDEEWEEWTKKDRQEDYKGRVLQFLFIGVPIFLSVDVFSLDRSLLSALGYSLLISALLMAGIAASNFSNIWSRFKNRESISGFLMHNVNDKFLILSLGFAYYTILASIYDFLRYLLDSSSRTTATLAVTLVGTLFMGGLLFYFRLKQRLIYGVTEVLVGLFIAGYRVMNTSQSEYLQPEFLLAILTAGVYLVVRGMDNVHQARKSAS